MSSKPPYRNLTENMKAMNQLSSMQAKSFKNTIGSGGFYSPTTQDDYDKMIAFGENLAKFAPKIERILSEMDDFEEKILGAIYKPNGMQFEEWLEIAEEAKSCKQFFAACDQEGKFI